MLRLSVVRIWYGFASLSPGLCLVLGRTNTARLAQSSATATQITAQIAAG
jgi:hypothetical protein